jgi:GNAT superfamily N-acetyltransferase
LLTAFAVSYTPERASFDATFPSLVASDHQALLVAEDGARVAGYALASVSLTLYANGPVAELLELVVEPDLRGKGIGKALVEAVTAWARDLGCAELNVPTRRAGDYYLRLGFEETAGYYRLRL